eukprot:TRINITY_DN300_c0_g2_i4.p3 TRINITY_DN300_c0_g2~~TRINITY_DN300_c0_g2_i4.p3  ORF type:complete len:130 (+),score=74.12 TRINITY_DN300_c0_g2_i4:62-451(+)
MVGTGMTREKLEKMAQVARVGGVRRRHKAVRKSHSEVDTKLQQNLKKLGVSPIADIEEVNFVMENGTVMHFAHPRVQASIQSNTYVVTGNPQTKSVAEMVPEMLASMGGNAAELQRIKEMIEKEGEKKQ